MTTEKAKVVKFDYAGIEIEGLLMPNGDYRIAVTQVAKCIFPSTPNNATKYVKAALPESLTATPILKTSSDLTGQKVNTITLDQFSEVVYYFAVLKGKPLAQALLKASVQFTITQAFEVALGVEKTNIEGKAVFEAMVKSKKARGCLTDTWKVIYEQTGCFPSYGKHTLDVYTTLGILDKYQAYKEKYGINNKTYTFRHHYLGEIDRDKITEAETNIKFMINKLGMTVEEAIEKL